MNTRFPKADVELTSHPFFKDLFSRAAPLIANSAVNNTPEKLPSNADVYILDVFDAVGALIQSFERLKQCRCLAVLPPSEKYLKGQGMTLHDWLEHTFSTFLITFVTIDDQALFLVNNVFALGIDPKQCRANVVKTNKWVKDTSIPKSLDLVGNAVKRLRTPRNLFVHGGKTPSLDNLLGVEKFDRLKKISFAFDHKPELFSNEMKVRIDKAYIEVFTKADKWLGDEISKLTTALSELLTNLHKHYGQRLSLLD